MNLLAYGGGEVWVRVPFHAAFEVSGLAFVVGWLVGIAIVAKVMGR